MPSDFLARFPDGQRVVFVGNAPSLKGEKLGKWIDNHDVVVRFNESPVLGYEVDVGARTDILISNPYPKDRRPFSLSERGVVLIISPQTRRLPSSQFESWVGEYPILFTYTPDIVQVGGVEHMVSLTTGVYGVHLLSRLLKPSHVSITGFTLFLNDTSHHYWRTETPRGLHAHDIKVEASIFISICNSLRCALAVTEDIGWVARRAGKQLRRDAYIQSLVNPKWKS
jgi:hypothetical protein